MRPGMRLLMMEKARENTRRDGMGRRMESTDMTMGGYGMESNQGGQMRNEMQMGGYGAESRFRDRRGREHYDNGRYAPMRNEMGYEGPYSSGNRYDIDVNRYEYEAPEGNYRNEMRGGRNGDRRGDTRMEMGGYEDMGMNQERMESRRNPVGFAARFDSPGSSDASYQRMDEMSHRSGSKMDHGGAMSHQMPKFDERMAKEWVSRMENEDGTRGPHWTMDQTTKVMEQRGIKEDPAKFYAALNMMYSDYCEVAKKINANNMDFFAEMAKAFLKDKDVGAPDKLAAYYEYVVKG